VSHEHVYERFWLYKRICGVDCMNVEVGAYCRDVHLR